MKRCTCCHTAGLVFRGIDWFQYREDVLCRRCWEWLMDVLV